MPRGRTGSDAPAVIALAETVGLRLDEWQRLFLDHALAYRADGAWCATQVCGIVGRQNGKGAILEAIELAGLFLWDEPLIVHSAHEYKTATEHYLRIEARLKSNPEFDDRVRNYYTAAGQRSIVLHNGQRLLFAARSGGAGRGFTGNKIVLDEAFALTDAMMGAMGPTMLTQRGRQVWYMSSAPKVDSETLHRVRAHAIEGGKAARRLFYAEWGNEVGTAVHLGDGDLNWPALAVANPNFLSGTDHEITEEAFEDALVELGEVEFARECLGIPSMPDGGANVFGPGKWQSCEDRDSAIVDDPVVALQVGDGMEWASFAAAGLRADGVAHVELIRRDPGTGWIVEYAKRFKEIVVNPRTPTAGFLTDLRDAGVKLVEISGGEFAKACAGLQHEVIDAQVRHIGQGPLDAAVNGAAITAQGETWVWAAARSTLDISPLVAATLALAQKRKKKKFRSASF